jgi:hypothetical protein
VRSPYEPGPKEQILGRIPGRGELGKDDEICTRLLRALDVAQDPLAVPVEVAHDDVQLRERDSQGFRLTVTNRV